MIAEIKRYTIKVPSNISIYYCDKTQIIIFSSPHKRRALKLKLKLVINQTKKNIQVTQNSFFSVSFPELAAFETSSLTSAKSLDN